MLLLRALDDGTIAAGSALPSELELMQLYQVSRNTVRHALARLEHEKRITRRRGSGTFARQTAPGRPSAWPASVPDDMQTISLDATARTLQFGRSRTPGHIRARWPDFGEEILLVQRVWSLQRYRVALCTVHVDAVAGKNLRRATLGATSIFTALQSTGAGIGRVSQTCRALAADAVAAEHLGVIAGTPLLMLTRWVLGTDNQPLLHQELAYRGDLYEMSMELFTESGPDGLRLTSGQSAPQASPGGAK